MFSFDGSTPIQSIYDAFGAVGNAIKKYHDIKAYYGDNALSDITKLTNVEPIVVLSKDLINVDYMPDVMNTLLNMFAGYYLQAVAVVANIDSAKVIRTLDKLNPDRDASGFLMTLESIKDHATMDIRNYKYRLPTSRSMALEGKDDKSIVDPINLGEVSSLAVGKLVEITIKVTKDEKSTDVKVPIAIRLSPAVISNTSITKILSLKTEDTTLVERFHSWRSGRIRFIKDLILCQDLIDEAKKTMMNDDSQVYNQILSRVMNAKKFGLLTNNPSFAAASNLFIMSEEVANDVEVKLGGKFSNKNIIAKAFDSTYAMIIAVVDREWERVTFYTRGVAGSANYSIKEIKNVSKNGKGPDILDILKQLQIGNNPSF